MIEDIRIIRLCNVLILQLIILSLSAKMPALDQLDFLRIVWRALKIPFLPKAKIKAVKQREKFWEIDMTKFEP